MSEFMHEIERLRGNYERLVAEGALAKPDLKPFDTFTLAAPDCLPAYGENGYVVIPDEWPIDYVDDVYTAESVLTATDMVHGLTFGGHAVISRGKLSIWYNRRPLQVTEEEEQLLCEVEVLPQSYSVKVIGFDDSHYRPNDIDAKSGAAMIADALKKIYLEDKDGGQDDSTE